MSDPQGRNNHRQTFRPPWVRDEPPSLPLPLKPWSLNSRRNRESNTFDFSPSNRMQGERLVGTHNEDENDSLISVGIAEDQINRRAPLGVRDTSDQLDDKDGETDPELVSRRPVGGHFNVVPKLRDDQNTLSKSDKPKGPPTSYKNVSKASVLPPPPPTPPPPPPPPPRPPPPPPSRRTLTDLPPLTDKQARILKMLKSRPRKRPDWASMMKEVETGTKLRHVTCNDRSTPLIERVITKVTDDPEGNAHFVFDSERSNVHNKLLRQIQDGVRLKKVVTNDRSKPILDGLRKFRRQLTIEEQMLHAEQSSGDTITQDELDDIDAVRDDLQSTKQMLALELRDKENLMRENEKLKDEIRNLRASSSDKTVTDDLLEHMEQRNEPQVSLEYELHNAKLEAQEFKKLSQDLNRERDQLRERYDQMEMMYFSLKERMDDGIAQVGCPKSTDIVRSATQIELNQLRDQKIAQEGAPTDVYCEEIVHDDASEEHWKLRELVLLRTKMKHLRDKFTSSKTERESLKDRIRHQRRQVQLEQEKFRNLKREIDRIARSMLDSEEDVVSLQKSNEFKTERAPDFEEDRESEESETDSSDCDDQNYADYEPDELRIRIQRHENRLAALKKGNYMLKTQLDRLTDELTSQKGETSSLQEDLDSVLAELE